MTSVARWSLAVTSTLAVLAATGFAAGYTSIEMNDVRYKRLDNVLPVATKRFAQTAPWMIGATAVFAVISGIAAARRVDSAVIVAAAVAWLFAFAWVPGGTVILVRGPACARPAIDRPYVMPHERRHGLITGPITLRDERGSHDLRASTWSGPCEGAADGVSVVEHDAQSMVLVEKNTIFARLQEDDFATKHHCALFCGNGFPGRSFRALVRQLHNQLRLPFYVLADNDPAGYELFFLTAREIAGAAYLGLRVRDYQLLGLPDWVQITLSDAEREQLLRLKARPWVESDVPWQLELDALLQRGFKVEMEALCSVAVSCFADRYIPERLAAADHLRLPSAARREA